jgi:hypothetical protein
MRRADRHAERKNSTQDCAEQHNPNDGNDLDKDGKL